MAKVTEASKSVSVAQKSVVLAPALQRFVKNLRDARDLEKKSKELAKSARESILNALGEVTENLIVTDAKGKRLVSVKVIPSSERLDLDRLAEEQPEVFAIVQTYKVARGAGEPTLRVDVL